MFSFKDEKDVARFLLCSSILEEKVANAYNHLSYRTENPQIRTLLNYIYLDTAKQATILRNMSESIVKLDMNIEDCENVWGKIWRNLFTDSVEELSKKEKMTDKELLSLIDGMKNLQGFIGESYLTILHVKTLKLIAEQRNISLGNFNTILEWIVEDEKRHEATLIMIKNLITKQPEKHPQRFVTEQRKIPILNKTTKIIEAQQL